MNILFLDKDKPNAIINTCVAKIRAIRTSVRQLWRPYENKFIKEDIEAEKELAKVDYATGTCRIFGISTFPQEKKNSPTFLFYESFAFDHFCSFSYINNTCSGE